MRKIILKIISNNTWSGRLLARLNLIRRLLLCPYVKLSFIPYRSIILFLNSNPDRLESFKLTDTGIFILFYSTYVIKVPLGPIPLEDLIRNKNQYNLIKESKYKAYVNYWLEDHGAFFKMELLLEGNDKKALIEQYFMTISKTAYASINSKKDIYELISIGQDKFINITQTELPINKDKRYPISIMHGDLTPKNIMTNSFGTPLLIDLNRFNFEGFEFIDRIHFEVEFESKKIRENYFHYIVMNFSRLLRIYGNEMLKIYVLYRIGSEHNQGIKNEHWYYDGMKELGKKMMTISSFKIDTAYTNER